MSSITLHPEFGVNPGLDICFWCGEATGVLLYGRNRGKEAPRKSCSGYDPCDACKGEMAKGVAIIEVYPSVGTEDRPEIQQGLYPTGRWLVMTDNAVRRIFDEGMAAASIEKRKAFAPKEVLDLLTGASKNGNDKG